MPILVEGLRENGLRRKDISRVYRYVCKYFFEKGLDAPENIVIKVSYKSFLFPPKGFLKIHDGVYVSKTVEENIVWINFNALINIILYRLLIAFFYMFFKHNLVKPDVEKIKSLCDKLYLNLLKYVSESK